MLQVCIQANLALGSPWLEVFVFIHHAQRATTLVCQALPGAENVAQDFLYEFLFSRVHTTYRSHCVDRRSTGAAGRWELDVDGR